MALSEKEIARLVLKFIGKDISPEEIGLLQQYLDESLENRRRFAEWTKIPVLKTRLLEYYNSIDTDKEDAAWQQIRNRLREQALPEQAAPPVRLRSFHWVRYAAAAVVIVTAGLLVYQLTGKKSGTDTIKPLAAAPANDVLPGSDKAILTLADGHIIMLDSAHIGQLSRQGNTRVTKIDSGRLAYQPADNALTAETSPVFNILSTPRGGQYQVTLHDGTRVWLNAASSIKYPTAFNASERRVSITGEAYFEVAHLTAKNGSRVPFKVDVDNTAEVEVLGTHFNVNAYADEAGIKTTLLEGSVHVLRLTSHDVQVLVPGQQALLRENTPIKLIKDADLDEVMAWKNGQFQFTGAKIETIMRQLARWYDLQVSYQGTTDREFVGRIPRNVTLSNVLKILEATGYVSFKINDKNITVLPVSK